MASSHIMLGYPELQVGPLPGRGCILHGRQCSGTAASQIKSNPEMDDWLQTDGGPSRCQHLRVYCLCAHCWCLAKRSLKLIDAVESAHVGHAFPSASSGACPELTVRLLQVGTVRGEDWNFQFSGKILDGVLHFRLQMQYEGDESEQASC